MNQSANILRKDFNYLRSQLLIPCSALLLATGIEVASRSSGPLQLFSLPALARGMVMLSMHSRPGRTVPRCYRLCGFCRGISRSCGRWRAAVDEGG